MKKFYLLPAFAALMAQGATAQFGIFASAVQISTDGGANASFYNTNKLVGDPNAIGMANFTGSLGSFGQFTNTLKITGGEIKTFKGGNDNVCGGILNYRVFPQGSPGGAFKKVNLSFFANCNGNVFADGKGPCGGNDQKWQNIAASETLTSYAPGEYTLEIYYEASGKDGSTTACDGTTFDSNNRNNYLANFTIVSTLPVKLISFNGAKSNEGIRLAWETATETNFSRFEVERSTDGINFSQAGEVKGKGNSSVRNRYSFMDRSAQSGVVYYRLKLVDLDGRTGYSPTINASLKSSLKMKIMPNPVVSELQVQGTSAGDRIVVTNILGVPLVSQMATSNISRLTVSQLPAGRYQVSISNGTSQTTLPFVKQ